MQSLLIILKTVRIKLHSPNQGKCAPAVEIAHRIRAGPSGTLLEQCRTISERGRKRKKSIQTKLCHRTALCGHAAL